MTVKCLSPADKLGVLEAYKARISQTDIAGVYAVSRRTIQRVLQEHGVLPPPSITVPRETVKPLVTRKDVELFLVRCTDEELTNIYRLVESARYIKRVREKTQPTEATHV